MLKQRVITAIVMLAVLFPVLFLLPELYFQLLLIAAFGVGAWEWARLSNVESPRQCIAYAVAMALIIALSAIYTGIYSGFVNQPLLLGIMLVACVGWVLAAMLVIAYPAATQFLRGSLTRGLVGLVVLVPAALALLYARGLPHGEWLFCYMLGIVAMADIGAYFSGRQWGRRKLMPAVSPGKSWAGFWGGFASVAVFAFVIGTFGTVAGLHLPMLILLTCVASVASVFGDLFESMLKRQCGMKDSSQLLPGHGGVLDRMDSMLAAAPVFILGVIAMRLAA